MYNRRTGSKSHVLKKKGKSSKGLIQNLGDVSGSSADPFIVKASSEMVTVHGWLSGGHS